MRKARLSLLGLFLTPAVLWAAEAEKNHIQYPEWPKEPAHEEVRQTTPMQIETLLYPGSRSVRLQSKAFEAEAPTAPQIGIGLSLQIPHHQRSSRFLFDWSQAQYRSLPQPLTPSDLSETQMSLRYENLSEDLTPGQSWNWGFAFALQKSEAKATLPNTLVASRFLAHAGVVTTRASQDFYQPDLRLALLVPFFQQELSARSGDFRSGGRVETQILFQAGRWQELGIRFGLEINMEQLNYSGLGERGSRDASETQLDLRFPIGLEWTCP